MRAVSQAHCVFVGGASSDPLSAVAVFLDEWAAFDWARLNYASVGFSVLRISLPSWPEKSDTVPPVLDEHGISIHLVLGDKMLDDKPPPTFEEMIGACDHWSVHREQGDLEFYVGRIVLNEVIARNPGDFLAVRFGSGSYRLIGRKDGKTYASRRVTAPGGK